MYLFQTSNLEDIFLVNLVHDRGMGDELFRETSGKARRKNFENGYGKKMP